MDGTEQAPESTSVNYPLPGISSRRIFRRAAIRLNLSKESGRWNETQKTEWPYPSTYVRHQMPSKYHRGWGNELSNDFDIDPDTELNPLIIEYQKGLFDAGLVPGWVHIGYTPQARSNKDKSSSPIEETEATVSEGQAGDHRDFETHLKNVFSPDSWKRVTKIEEVETDDEDVEKMTNKKAVTQTATNTDNEGWLMTNQELEDPISNQEERMGLQDLQLQYVPEDDIFTPNGTDGKMNHHSSAYTPQTRSPVSIPLIIIQASPETGVLLGGYDQATPENHHPYQNLHPHLLTQHLGCESPLHQSSNHFQETHLRDNIGQELHRMQALHNDARYLQLPRGHGSSMHDLITAEPDWAYGPGPLIHHAAATQPQREEEYAVVMNQMEKMRLHQRGLELHHLILDHLSLEETLACSPPLYHHGLVAEDDEMHLKDPILEAIATAAVVVEEEVAFPLTLALA